jgi:anti-sigma B factor antagonist
MELIVEDMPNGITKAVLVGRMDIEGAATVDLRMNVLAGHKPALVVDLSGVSFLASMGLRTLMVCARAMALKGHKMALVGPQPNVEKVLLASGADEIMGIFGDFDVAASAVRS